MEFYKTFIYFMKLDIGRFSGRPEGDLTKTHSNYQHLLNY